MSSDSSVPAPRRRIWPRVTAGLVLFVLIGLVVAWLAKPKEVSAVALFEVRMEAPLIVGNLPTQPNGQRDYELLRKTQIALLKSKFVPKAALVNPGVAALSILAGKPDPVTWLQEHLEVSFPENGEILEIRLRGSESQVDDLRTLVDAVAEAYKKEVIGSELQRKNIQRDMVARNLESLNNEIKRKFEDYLDIAKGMGRLEGDRADLQQQLTVKQLDRADDERVQVERDLWKLTVNEDSKDSKLVNATKQRLAELTKRRDSLQKQLEGQIANSVDLETRKAELDLSRKLANDMWVQLERMDIEMSAPPQIRQIGTVNIEPAQVASGF